MMNQSSHRWPAQPVPVLNDAVRWFADLRRESVSKRDDRQVTS